MTMASELNELTPYLQFNRQEWCHFRKNAPLTLIESDLDKLQGQTEIVSLKEVTEIYLPLSRLLSLYVTARQTLHRATSQFLGNPELKVPYIIGIAGSVAVGKSTTSRVLKALLSRWPDHPNVEIITTDGFLYPNMELERQGLMKRKGFPESYNMSHLLYVLNAIKSGQRDVHIPIYSHHYYDIVCDQYEIIDQPDIVILEGLNILQTGGRTPQRPKIFVSDFFDFSVFVDADIEIIKKSYINRVLNFWRTTFSDPSSYFHNLTKMVELQVVGFAEQTWNEINKINLFENILPYKNRAQLILEKGANHSIQKVYLRKI